MCAELLPELIALDDWGYPIVDGKVLAPELVANAERAAAACPTFALLIDRRRAPAPVQRERPVTGVRNVRRRVPRLPGGRV